MVKLIIVRHGNSIGNYKRIFIGQTDWGLSEVGEQQVERLTEYLKQFHIDKIYSSDLCRAYNTVLPTAQRLGLPIHKREGLREIYAGEWDGLTFAEIRRRYPDLYAARAKDLTLPIPGAEDQEAALVRFRCDLEQAAREAPGDFAVVAHGGIIAKFLETLTGTWRKPDYTEVIPLIWEKGQFYTKDSSKNAGNKKSFL